MKRPPRSRVSEAAAESTIEVSRLPDHVANWLLTGDIAHHSPRTLDNRRRLLDQLVWFLRDRRVASCGTPELRAFMAYLAHGHEETGGRWGNPLCTKPLRATTLQTYHGHLRTLFAWLVKEGVLRSSPMDRIPVPVVRKDQVLPFSAAETDHLVRAARSSKQPKRDEALIILLLDTGLRSSEVCSLKVGDVDLNGRICRVVGKGNKVRQVPFGKVCAKALRAMLMGEERSAEAYLFAGQRGRDTGAPMTRSGLQQLIERLAAVAGVRGARIGPHRLRHTFALEFLRSGGNMFALQAILGHESIDMTRRYVRIAQADIVQQHQAHSPADRLRGAAR